MSTQTQKTLPSAPPEALPVEIAIMLQLREHSIKTWPNEWMPVVHLLIDRGLVETTDELVSGYSACLRPVYHLSKSGKVYLGDWEYRTQKEADDQAEKKSERNRSDGLRREDIRRSWWQFFLGLLIGWFLGALTPQTVGRFVRSLFP